MFSPSIGSSWPGLRRLSPASRLTVLLSAVVTVFFIGYYFVLMVIVKLQIDVQMHVFVLYETLRGKAALPGNAGFYGLVYLFSGFSSNYRVLVLAAIVVVSLLWGAIIWSSYRLAGPVFSATAGGGVPARQPLMQLLGQPTARLSLVAAWAALWSCFLYAIPVNAPWFYMGVHAPNVYHNSTILAAMPFSLLAFVVGTIRLRDPLAPNLRLDGWLMLALALTCVFKPSYVMALLPAYCLLYVLRARFNVAAMLRLVPVGLVPCLIILGQYLWTNAHPEASFGERSVVVVAFPSGWRYLVPEFSTLMVLAAALSSFALPLLTYSLRPAWLRRLPHQLGVVSIAMGLLLFMVVHEDGHRATNGNFNWQIIAANHVLHWVILLDTLAWTPTTPADTRRRQLILGLAAVETFCAFLYLAKILFYASIL